MRAIFRDYGPDADRLSRKPGNVFRYFLTPLAAAQGQVAADVLLATQNGTDPALAASFVAGAATAGSVTTDAVRSPDVFGPDGVEELFVVGPSGVVRQMQRLVPPPGVADVPAVA